MTEPRRFSDQEVAKILKRAAELQKLRGDNAQGLSLEEIEQAAYLAGIDPALVRQGAEELLLPTPKPLPVQWWGGPFRLCFSTTLAGDFPEDQLPAIRQWLQDYLGIKGKSTLKNKRLIWRMPNNAEGRKLIITLAIQRKGTLVRIEEDLSGLAGGLYGGLGGGLGGGMAAPAMFLGIGLFNSPWLGILLMGGSMAGALALARQVYVQTAQQRQLLLQRLFEELVLETRQNLS